MCGDEDATVEEARREAEVWKRKPKGKRCQGAIGRAAPDFEWDWGRLGGRPEVVMRGQKAKEALEEILRGDSGKGEEESLSHEAIPPPCNGRLQHTRPAQ